MIKLFLFVTLILCSIFTFSQKEIYSKVRINLNNKNSIDVAKLGISLEGCVIKQGEWLEGIFSKIELEHIQNNNFEVIPIISNVTKYYVDRNKNNDVKTINSGCNNQSQYYNTPQNFKLGSFGGFLTYDELLAELDSMKSKFPNLITSKTSIASQITIEGREIYYLKISDNPDFDESEPEVLYTALHHAREPASMQQMIFYMYYLLENYGINQEVTYLVDNLELYFIPCVNPDGYIYNQSTDPNGGGLFRKNRRNNGDGTYGVDLNRNYGYEWGFDDSGSSPSTNMDSYRGTSGFSEPETQAMKNFIENHNFKIALNYHTYSDLLIYPWGYTNSFFTPDHNIFTEYGTLLTSENLYVHGNPMQTVGYTGNGTSDDWMYGEQNSKGKIFAMSPEAGKASDGFWPQTNRIEEICRVNVSMNLYLAHLALKYAVVEEENDYIISNINSDVKYKIKNLGLDNPSSYSIQIIPISSNIISTGAVKYYTNMSILENFSDSISIELNPNIQQGEYIEYIIATNNGSYTKHDSIRKIFGNPVVAFYDNCSNKNNWTSTKWNVSTSQFYSSGGSLTDSPSGNYSANENSIITLNNNIDLTDASKAFLSFRTKYDIEEINDFVQLTISKNNGSTWEPLCGKYTTNSQNASAAGQPVYEGLSAEWKLEEIDLSNYAGENVKFKFQLKSDWVFWLTNDGFYFDDFLVRKILNSTVNQDNYYPDLYVNCFPNPASDELNFQLIGIKGGKVKIINTLGQILIDANISENSNKTKVDISDLKSGTYYYIYTNKNSISKKGKIVIIR